MKPRIYHRSDCAQAQGICVVIDVLRAFTTAAFAFDGGAEEITLVSTPEEALKKYRADNSLILMGEDEGLNIKGFHLGNSPAEIQNAEVSGRRLVQRTSSGTQGAVACREASHMLLASFVVAEATLKQIKQLNIWNVSFIITGRSNGDEDLALAEYLQERLLGRQISVRPFLERVRKSPAAQRMLASDPAVSPYAKADLQLALDLNRFPFAMQVFKQNNELISRKVPIASVRT
jgi:2-phosphosulfolactate phosphatase